MAERSGFFNARPMTDEYGEAVFHEDGSQAYDREYTAAEFSELFALFMTTGIRNGGENLKIMAEAGSMNVKLLPGDAMIEGYYYKLEDDPVFLGIEAAAAAYARIDRVILRLDILGRKISAQVLQGIPAAEPEAPALTRNNEVYEIGLAEIFIDGQKESLTDGDIKDTRLDAEMCGLIHSLIEVDTTLLLNQMDTYFAEKKVLWEADCQGYTNWTKEAKEKFEGWFQEVQGTLWQNAYADFDNWAHMAGYTYVAEKQPDGSICEKIQGTVSGDVLAEKMTEKENNAIVETLVFFEPALGVRKTTQAVDGAITSRIEVIE